MSIQITQDREIYHTPTSADVVTPSTAFTSLSQFSSFWFEKRLPPLPFRELDPVPAYPGEMTEKKKARSLSDERMMEEGLAGSDADKVIDISAAAARSLPDLGSGMQQQRESAYCQEITVCLDTNTRTRSGRYSRPDSFSFSPYTTSFHSGSMPHSALPEDHFEFDLGAADFPSPPSDPAAPPGITISHPQFFQFDAEELPETFNFEAHHLDLDLHVAGDLGVSQTLPGDLRPALFGPSEAGSGESFYAI